MPHHVIYVPGLSDHRTTLQRLAPKYWKFFGVSGHYFRVHWHDKERFAPKLTRLLAMIDELAKDGSKVSLVGTSAGASAVLLAYAARQDKISGVVYICGKINHPETVPQWRYVDNPAFKDSLYDLQRALPKLDPKARARIMSIRPWYDSLVLVADTVIPGVEQKIIPTVGHTLSILAALVFRSGVMMRFLRKQVAVK